MRTFDRAATLREIARESRLTRDEVHAGLRGLYRRDLVIKEVRARQRGTYRLQPGAARPQEIRGTFERSPEVREQYRQVKLRYYASARAAQQNNTGAVTRLYSAAAPPAPGNAPGALRVVVKGVLDVAKRAATKKPATGCALADVWKKRVDRE